MAMRGRPAECSGPLLDVDLTNGRYTFTCRIVAENDKGEIIDHFEAGTMETVSFGS